MRVDSNLIDVLNTVDARLSSLQVQEMTHIQATTLMAKIRHRVHQEGVDSKGSAIGTYSLGYARYKRPQEGRGTSRKVIASLTRSMENSMVLYPLPNGTGIGYLTAENRQKAKWVEETYKKKIFSPTDGERALMNEIAQNYIAEHL